MRHPIRAITFDVGGTLIDPWPSVGQVYATTAAQHGVHGLSANELNARFLSAWRAASGRADSKEDWAAIVRATFDGLGPFHDPDSLFETLYARFAEPQSWRVFDDVRPTLNALQERGVRLGILSNWDNRLRALLRALGLAGHFEVIVISCEVGCRKPEPEIFNHAAQAFHLPPGAILHVGDSRELDVEAAERAGMRAVGIRRGTPQADARSIPELNALLRLLWPDLTPRPLSCGNKRL